MSRDASDEDAKEKGAEPSSPLRDSEIAWQLKAGNVSGVSCFGVLLADDWLCQWAFRVGNDREWLYRLHPRGSHVVSWAVVDWIAGKPMLRLALRAVCRSKNVCADHQASLPTSPALSAAQAMAVWFDLMGVCCFSR